MACAAPHGVSVNSKATEKIQYVMIICPLQPPWTRSWIVWMGGEREAPWTAMVRSLRFWADVFHDREFPAGCCRDHLLLNRFVDFGGEILNEDGLMLFFKIATT